MLACVCVVLICVCVHLYTRVCTEYPLERNKKLETQSNRKVYLLRFISLCAQLYTCVHTHMCASVHSTMHIQGGQGRALGVLTCQPPLYFLRQGFSIEAWVLIFQLGCQLAISSNPPVSALPQGWNYRYEWNHIRSLGPYVATGVGPEVQTSWYILLFGAISPPPRIAFQTSFSKRPSQPARESPSSPVIHVV